MKDENRPLTEKERAFCRYFVQQGCLNATKAAIRAGYAAKSAKVTASQLRADPRIDREIERLKTAPQDVVDEMIGKALAVVREDRPNPKADPGRAAMYAEAEKDIAAGLQRAYVIAGLIDNFEQCLGRRPTKVTKILKKAIKGADGKVEVSYEGVQLETYMVDSAGANRAGELLLKECDRMEGVNGDKPPESREHGLGDMIEKFKEAAGVTRR